MGRAGGELCARYLRLRGLAMAPGHLPLKESPMAKSQKKSSKEVRKPKAEKPKKQNASNPSQKGIAIAPKV